MAKITQAEYQTLAAFRYSVRKFLHFSEETARSVGLTPQQHQALLAVKGFPESSGRITISQLAERMQIRHHSAVGLVDRLAAQGLMRREPSESDRRSVYVTLSPKGLDVLEKLSAIHKQELRRMLPELQQLTGILAGEGRRG